jgi:hypothetical protein
MRKADKKGPKNNRTKKVTVKDLTVKDTRAIRGGLVSRKAGKGQQE